MTAAFFIPSPPLDKLHAKISPLGRGAALNNVRRSILLKVCRSRRFLWREICGKICSRSLIFHHGLKKVLTEKQLFPSLSHYILALVHGMCARPPISRPTRNGNISQILHTLQFKHNFFSFNGNHSHPTFEVSYLFLNFVSFSTSFSMSPGFNFSPKTIKIKVT
jgi:hypothetical protein